MPPTPPLSNIDFNLNVSGIAGFFGGESSYTASSTYLMRGRRWVGWYNAPGSFFVAKKYGGLEKAKEWDGLFPGANVDLTKMLELDNREGPRFIGVHSGTDLDRTGHLAYLLIEHCAQLPVNQVIEESSSSDFYLTVVHLDNCGEDTFIAPDGRVPSIHLWPFDPVSIIPILGSLAAVLVCGIFRDWYSFAMIVVGMICNGVSCMLIGGAVLEIKSPRKSSKFSPPGDGIFLATGSDQHFTILKGSERAVSTIIQGQYNLHYNNSGFPYQVGLSSIIFGFQFILQLFILPKGTLFGQIMFLSTFAVSWMYHIYKASWKRDRLQQTILLNVLQKPKTWTVRIPRYTILAVLATIVLRPSDPRTLLDTLIPNNSLLWRTVKDITIQGIEKDVDPKELLHEGDLTDVKDIGLLNDMITLASKAFNASKGIELSAASSELSVASEKV